MNKVQVSGRLADAPQNVEDPRPPRCRFNLEVAGAGRNQTFSIAVFLTGRIASNALINLDKGHEIIVNGRLEPDADAVAIRASGVETIKRQIVGQGELFEPDRVA